jgi:hypothetical protein
MYNLYSSAELVKKINASTLKEALMLIPEMFSPTFNQTSDSAYQWYISDKDENYALELINSLEC